MGLEPFEPAGFVERVDLVRDDQHWFVCQPLAGRISAREQVQLPRDHLEIVNWFAAADRGDVDQMDEDFGPLEMTEKTRAETVTVMRTFDQSRHVRDDERAIAG